MKKDRTLLYSVIVIAVSVGLALILIINVKQKQVEGIKKNEWSSYNTCR